MSVGRRAEENKRPFFVFLLSFLFLFCLSVFLVFLVCFFCFLKQTTRWFVLTHIEHPRPSRVGFQLRRIRHRRKQHQSSNPLPVRKAGEWGNVFLITFSKARLLSKCYLHQGYSMSPSNGPCRNTCWWVCVL